VWGVCSYGAVRTYTEGCDGMRRHPTDYITPQRREARAWGVWLIELQPMLLPWPEVSA